MCSRMQQASLPRASTPPAPKSWITLSTALSSSITQQPAIKSLLHSCTWISSLFPRKEKWKPGIHQQEDTAVASADFRFSPVERQSQTSVEGLGLRRQWAVQTSAGSQLQNGMKSNINIKTRWCTTFFSCAVLPLEGGGVLRKMKMTSIPLLLWLNLQY